MIDCLINPLQEQMEEWKKVANQLDKDHAKGTGYRLSAARQRVLPVVWPAAALGPCWRPPSGPPLVPLLPFQRWRIRAPETSLSG